MPFLPKHSVESARADRSDHSEAFIKQPLSKAAERKRTAAIGDYFFGSAISAFAVDMVVPS